MYSPVVEKQIISTEKAPGTERSDCKELHLADAIEQGYLIERYSQNNENDNYSVHVRKGNQTETFSNVTATNLALELDIPVTKLLNEWEISAEGQQQTFEKLMKEGWKIVGYNKHSKNDLYSVWVELNESHKTFSSISPEQLAKTLKVEVNSLDLQWSRISSEIGKIEKLKTLIKKEGAIKENQDEKVSIVNGDVLTFPRVSLANVSGYKDCIKQ